LNTAKLRHFFVLTKFLKGKFAEKMVSGGPLWCNGVWISGLSGNKNGRTTDGRPFSGVFLSLDYFTNTLDD
jgi:hypothetical protein